MKILCVGSLNIDCVYSVDHFVRAGETISSTAFSQVPGGKGLNQTVALAKAGADVTHAGSVGNDGNLLRNTLRSAGVDDSLLCPSPIPTGHAIIQVDCDGQNSIIVESGANGTLSRAYLTSMLDSFAPGDILLLQNETNEIPWLMEEGHRRKMTVVFNPSPVTPELKEYPLEYVNIFILNEIEGALLSGENVTEKIPAALYSRYPNSKIMLTLGGDGCVFFDGKHSVHQDAFRVKAVDTTAAGDTFTGFFLAGLTENLPIEYVLKMASAASAIAVTQVGASVSIPTRVEVEEFIRTNC